MVFFIDPNKQYLTTKVYKSIHGFHKFTKNHQTLASIRRRRDMKLYSIAGTVLHDSKERTVRKSAEEAVKKGVSLRGVNLWGARIRGACLRDADLRCANLKGAKLRSADLWNADLRRANLRKANLQSVNLQDADFRRANLEGAYLGDAYLRGANLRGAYLRDTCFSNANLKEADLRGANLEGAYLGGANFEDAELKGARGYWSSREFFEEIIRQNHRKVKKEEWRFVGIILVRRLCWEEINQEFRKKVLPLFEKVAKWGYGEYLERYKKELERN